MNFFFDNMMSPKLAKMVEVFTDREHRVRHIREDARFGHTTEDEIWISGLASDTDRWSIISGDLRMLSNSTIVAGFIGRNSFSSAWTKTGAVGIRTIRRSGSSSEFGPRSSHTQEGTIQRSIKSTRSRTGQALTLCASPAGRGGVDLSSRIRLYPSLGLARPSRHTPCGVHQLGHTAWIGPRLVRCAGATVCPILTMTAIPEAMSPETVCSRLVVLSVKYVNNRWPTKRVSPEELVP